jgi:hypothetical protein
MGGIVKSVKKAVKSVGKAVANVGKKVVKTVKKIADPVVKVVKDVGGKLLKGVKDIHSSVWKGIKGLAKSALVGVGKLGIVGQIGLMFIPGVGPILAGAISGAGQALAAGGSWSDAFKGAAMGGVTGALTGTSGGAAAGASVVKGVAQEGITSSLLSSAGKGALTGALKGAAVGGAISKLTGGSISDGLKMGAKSGLVSGGIAGAAGYSSSILPSTKEVGFGTRIANSLKDLAGSDNALLSGIGKVGTATIQIGADAADWAVDKFEAGKSFISESLNAVGEKVGESWDGFKSYVGMGEPSPEELAEATRKGYAEAVVSNTNKYLDKLDTVDETGKVWDSVAVQEAIQEEAKTLTSANAMSQSDIYWNSQVDEGLFGTGLFADGYTQEEVDRQIAFEKNLIEEGNTDTLLGTTFNRQHQQAIDVASSMQAQSDYGVSSLDATAWNKDMYEAGGESYDALYNDSKPSEEKEKDKKDKPFSSMVGDSGSSTYKMPETPSVNTARVATAASGGNVGAGDYNIYTIFKQNGLDHYLA